MDWQALNLSLLLGLWTAAILIPITVLIARTLAWHNFTGRSLLQAFLSLPLLLPPTVLGFYLLTAFGNNSITGKLYNSLTGGSLVFSFEGLLLASVIFNMPFALQPIQRAFEAIPISIREAAWCSGLSNWQTFWRMELPLAWQGVLSALILTFAHTLGEFGVVLMVGGNIPGATRTISIAIYDRVQAFDNQSAGIMSAVLLAIAFVSITLLYILNDRISRRHVQ